MLPYSPRYPIHDPIARISAYGLPFAICHIYPIPFHSIALPCLPIPFPFIQYDQKIKPKENNKVKADG
jgi:hypothetical protein